MKFAHIADLHLGKKLSNYDMSEDQRYILDQIVDAIVMEGVDALLIAGDVYDKHIPSEDATQLFSDFLTRLSKNNVPVFIAAGNHDSGRRLDYCSGILGTKEIHIAGEFKGTLERYELCKKGQKVYVHMLPFIRPYTVNIVCGTEVSGLDQAVKVVLDRSVVDPDAVNVLVAHQFVRDISGSELELGSEDQRPRAGGADMLASDMLNDFDYVALGHLHVPQHVGTEHIRYSGSPLKYSESEAHVAKSLTIVDVIDKDDIEVSTIPLVPLRDLRVVKGTLADIISGGGSEDYVYVRLDDMAEGVEAKLRKLFPRLCDVTFTKLEREVDMSRPSTEEIKEAGIDVLFSRFFQDVTSTGLTPSQLSILEEVVSEMGGGSE